MPTTDNIKEFTADLARVADIIHRNVVDIKRYAALRFYNVVTLPPHPVDTGYARANWRMGAGSPDTEVSTPPTAQERASHKGAGGWVPLPLANDGAINDAAIEVPIFVTNSVSYIGFLEDGTSKMAPRHFIARAIQAVEADFQSYIDAAEAKNGK